MKTCYALVLGAVVLGTALARNIDSPASEPESGIREVEEGFVPTFSVVDTTKFHTYAWTMKQIGLLRQNYPSLVRVETLYVTGTPYGHRAVVAVKVATNAGTNSDRPAVLFCGSHHGDELLGNDICLALMQKLAANQTVYRRLLDSLNIWFVPMVNPDGHEVTIDTRTGWRKNTRDNNNNHRFDRSSDGVNLNRNYPFMWPAGGSPTRSSAEYRGSAQGSEPEVQALMALVRREKFLAAIDLHSSDDLKDSSIVYYVWQWAGTQGPDYAYVRSIAQQLATTIRKYDGSPYRYGYGVAENGGYFRNWSYFDQGTLTFLIEVGKGNLPPSSQVDSVIKLVHAGCFALMNRALSTGLNGIVRDSLTGTPVPAQVILAGVDSAVPHPILPRHANSLGRYRRILNAGSYTLHVSAPGYRSKTVGPVAVVSGAPVVVNVALAPVRFDGSGPKSGPAEPVSNRAEPMLDAAPNPFRYTTQVNYSVTEPGMISLRMYDIRGSLVQTLTNGFAQAGRHSVSLDRAQSDTRLLPGTYLVVLETSAGRATEKLIIR